MKDRAPGSTVRVRFNTHQLDGTPITLVTGAVAVYKHGNTTESTAGVVLTTDYDGRTGYHDVTIDTSADGTFYAGGNDFDVVLTAGTVDGTSVVGVKVGEFSLHNDPALRPTTAGRTLNVTAGGEAESLVVDMDTDVIDEDSLAASAVNEINANTGFTGLV